MDWLVENDPASTGDLPGRPALGSEMAQGFIEDAARRNRALAQQFSQIEDALRKLMATPLFQHDEHCQNLMARIARAGTMRDFADRIDDLHFHIRRLTAQTADGPVPRSSNMLVLTSAPVADLISETSSADSGRSGGARAKRYRLKI